MGNIWFYYNNSQNSSFHTFLNLSLRFGFAFYLLVKILKKTSNSKRSNSHSTSIISQQITAVPVKMYKMMYVQFCNWIFTKEELVTKVE